VTFTVRQDAILRAVRRDGSVKVTEIAQELGTSQMTVRRDIAVLAEQGVVDRVHGGATLPRGETVPRSDSAGGPPRGRQLSIGMAVPGPSHYYQQVVEGARSAANAMRVKLTVRISPYDADQDRAQIQELLEGKPDGLLLTPSQSLSRQPDLLAWIRELPVPVVMVERRPDPASGTDLLGYVTSHHEHGTLQALEHLRRLGHSRIALLAYGTATSDWIVRGFETATAAFDLPTDVPRVVRENFRFENLDIDTFLDAVVASGATATVVHPDEPAILVAQRARARGLAVPGDLAIVAHDDELAGLADQPITAVVPPRVAVGRTALRHLVQAIVEGDAYAPQHTYLTPRLSIRTSTVK
jgi:DNA-binding LacI/PurR family transcriptional regulator